MGTTTDIDIDVPDRDAVLRLFQHVPASIITPQKFDRHNSGVYFHRVPQDPLTGYASISHKEAEARGYFKIDVLPVNAYRGVRDEEHLLALMEQEPPWELFEIPAFVKGNALFQIANHADVVARMKPRSIEQLAMILGLIRPAKKHLQDRPWAEVAQDIWLKPSDARLAESFFKRAHAICYATVIVVQVNLIVEELLAQEEMAA